MECFSSSQVNFIQVNDDANNWLMDFYIFLTV